MKILAIRGKNLASLSSEFEIDFQAEPLASAAVLLAQNDFAALLKAADDERAELLQTLTGTETFSQISKQAFARMKAESEKLELLQSNLKDQAPLLPDVRAKKELQRQTQTDSIKAQSEHKAEIEGFLRWQQHWDQLKANQADATHRLAAATTERDLAAPRFAQLTRVLQVQAARPLWSELDRLRQQISGTEKVQLDSQKTLDASTAVVITNEVAHNAAMNQLAAAEISRSNSQPDINAAKALDASIIALTPQFEAAKKSQENANQLLQTQQSRKDAADKRLAQSLSHLAAIDAWMAEHVKSKPLAEGWQLWETLFAQAQGHQKQLDKTTLDIKELTTTAHDITEAQAKVHTDTATVNSHFSEAGQKLEALTHACAGVDIDKLLRDKQQLECRLEQLQSAAQLWQKRCDLQNQRIKLHEQQKAQKLLRSSCNQELLDWVKAQPLLEQDLATAEQSLSLSKLAASKGAETLRTALQADQPCPVCGSLEHPYATHSPVVDAMLKSLQDQVKDKRKSLDQLLQRVASTTTNQANAEQQIQRLVKELTQLERNADFVNNT